MRAGGGAGGGGGVIKEGVVGRMCWVLLVRLEGDESCKAHCIEPFEAELYKHVP